MDNVHNIREQTENILCDLMRIKMSLEAIRSQLNQAMVATVAQIDAMMPEVEPQSARSARDWKQELKTWRKAK